MRPFRADLITGGILPQFEAPLVSAPNRNKGSAEMFPIFAMSRDHRERLYDRDTCQKDMIAGSALTNRAC